jgi:hypothetical protein
MELLHGITSAVYTHSTLVSTNLIMKTHMGDSQIVKVGDVSKDVGYHKPTTPGRSSSLLRLRVDAAAVDDPSAGWNASLTICLGRLFASK